MRMNIPETIQDANDLDKVLYYLDLVNKKQTLVDAYQSIKPYISKLIDTVEKYQQLAKRFKYLPDLYKIEMFNIVKNKFTEKHDFY